MTQTIKTEIMLRTYAKKFKLQFIWLCCLFTTTSSLGQKTINKDYIFDVWRFKDKVESLSEAQIRLVEKYTPEDCVLDMLFVGKLDKDNEDDYAIVYKSKNASDEKIAGRPLILLVSNYGKLLYYRNNFLISPYHFPKGFTGIVFKKPYFYLLDLSCSQPESACIYAQIFYFNNRKKVVHVNSASYKDGVWSQERNKNDGLFFEEIIE